MLEPSTHFVGTLALVAIAQGVALSAPLPNLVLSCPEEDAVNRVALDGCHGYVYDIPTNERIVVSPSASSYFWRLAADLTESELVQVCTIPVEPGAYSSCRDAAGVRRTAYVPKSTVINGSRNSVTVAKSGGDYTDPVIAAQNAFAGDRWCQTPTCVMAIGDGVFILRATLNIPDGLFVSGNGKGSTMLVADNGIEIAATLSGNARIAELTIINSQPVGARTTGLESRLPSLTAGQQLAGVAIHVSGAAQNVALTRESTWLEILDSEITAVGPDSTGIFSESVVAAADITLERSRVSAQKTVDVRSVAYGQGRESPMNLRLVDSHVSGAVSFDAVDASLWITRSHVEGNVTANNPASTRVFLTDASIRGNADFTPDASVRITNVSVESKLHVGRHTSLAFDRLTVHGQLVLEQPAVGSVSHPGLILRRSYIINTATTEPALLIRSNHVGLEQSFVQGTPAVVVEKSDVLPGRLVASSSVLAGPVSGYAASSYLGAVLSCTDTYGADYELLSASCQAQVP